MKNATARDIMNPEVMTVQADMTVHELASFLIENEFTGAPVLDEQGHLVGVVSVTDVAKGETDEATFVPDPANPESYVRGWEDKMNREDLRRLHIQGGARLVREIMTPATYTVREDTPVPAMARTMTAGRIHRLLVMRGRRLVGIVTTLDMLKLLCEEG
jgi:CBS domain-containing protein